VKAFIIFLLSLMAALFVGEVWFRTVTVVPSGLDRIIHPYIALGGYVSQTNDYPNSESYEAVGYQNRGWLKIPTFPFGGGVNSSSERGQFLFQDRVNFAIQSSSKAFRFFVLGGSTALGAGATSPESRWFNRLENKLEKALGGTVLSIPAATPSQVTTQERIIQDLYVIPNHPNAMIFLDGINDCTTFASATRPGDPNGQGVIYRRYESPLFGFLTDISKHSSLVRLLMYNEVARIWSASREDRLNLMGEYTSSVANVYFENIAAMKHRCDLEKIPCYFFLQPARPVTLSNRNLKSDFSQDPTVMCYKEILTRRKNYPYLHSLTSVFDKIDHNLYIDDAHFDDEGHEIVADEIAKVVLELGIPK
jgi:hypothetical protein